MAADYLADANAVCRSGSRTNSNSGDEHEYSRATYFDKHAPTSANFDIDPSSANGDKYVDPSYQYGNSSHQHPGISIRSGGG